MFIFFNKLTSSIFKSSIILSTDKLNIITFILLCAQVFVSLTTLKVLALGKALHYSRPFVRFPHCGLDPQSATIKGFSLIYWIKSSHSRKETSSFSSRLLRFFVPLTSLKVLAFGNKKKNKLFFCISLI